LFSFKASGGTNLALSPTTTVTTIPTMICVK
jgi:hypothetical protein